ncbi:site-specific integrase [Ferruginibacter albus]|uniref:site-specific integrase n=1 Tax=Ferruginibacter albus TaxID=2875540 RepID=UPI001CC7B248|nr:site-specific integrase [Ferruginibacter albus]UAY51281.1 site-specific integrase [Ferruginibacter albus]
MLKATTATFLDTRRIKKNGTYPVKVRVTFERWQKYYPTPIDLTKDDYEKVMFGKRQTSSEKSLKIKIDAFEKKAIEVIEKLSVFTWSNFEKQFLSNRAAKDEIFLAFEERAKELRLAGQIGTAVAYECSQRSLNEFAPKTRFADITPEFLRNYEKWMVKKGNSLTTVSMYLRSLRTLFNNVIAEGFLTQEYYPFGKRKYEVPTGNNIKKALTLQDIAKIYYYKPKQEFAQMSKDYWFFMYLCNGINVKDMCLLKYENIKGDVLEYERAKTARTKRKIEPIRVMLSEDLKAIINKWGNKKKDNNTYVFPVLNKELDAENERRLIQQLTHVINDNMKKVAKELEIDGNVTTYAARHSFATILQRSGASTEFISEALGHSNVRTTQSYLAGFEDESKKEAIKALIAFKI